MKKLLAIAVLGLLWSNSGYSYVMQDLIETLEETKKPKSIEVAKTLKSINANEKSYDLVIRKANLNLFESGCVCSRFSWVGRASLRVLAKNLHSLADIAFTSSAS